MLAQIGMNLHRTDAFPYTGAGTAFGLLFSDDFARASIGSDYISTVTTATWACNGSALTVTGGDGTASNRLKRDYPFSSESNVQVVTAQLTSTPSSSTGGLAVGFSDLSNPDGERDVYVRLITNNNSGDFGKAQIITFNGTTGAVRATSSTAISSVVLNNVFTYTCTHSIVAGVRTYSATITRQSGGSSSVSWTEKLTNPVGEELMYSTAYPALFTIGGNFTITLWSCTINDLKNAYAMFIGASITHVFYATDFTTRYAAQIGAEYPGYVVSAGSGDGTQRIIDKMTHLLAMRPRVVFLEGGGASNDVANSVTEATWVANMLLIHDRLRKARIHVIHLYPFPNNSYNVSVIINYQDLYFLGHDPIVDIFTPLKDGTGYDAAYSDDGAHPNQDGHDLTATTAITTLRL